MGFQTCFSCSLSHGSEKGYKELRMKYACRKNGPEIDVRYGEKGHPVGNACLEDPEIMWNDYSQKYHNVRYFSPEKAQEMVNSVFKQYYEEIKKSKNNKDKKLTAIARCCQYLEQMHLFEDGNIRTIAFTVLPKMLLENGLQPTILPNPNIFDAMSVDEIKEAIHQGQETFQALKESYN